VVRTDHSPRRRLHPQQRRATILEAAIEAFGARGYPGVTMTAIAAAAGASEALVYRYFGSKDALYLEVVQVAIDDLRARQASAFAGLPEGTSVRDRVRAVTAVYLDHIAHHPVAWALPQQRPGSEPAAVAELRRSTRADSVARLGRWLSPRGTARRDYALWGYFGFLDAACLRWVDRGCPDIDRWSLVDAALGALEGALGDWGGSGT
jgi:AcrR family transcriptional regulator